MLALSIGKYIYGQKKIIKTTIIGKKKMSVYDDTNQTENWSKVVKVIEALQKSLKNKVIEVMT